MNALGVALVGIVARGTAVAALGVLLCLALKRRPAAGALAASTALAVLVGVMLLAASPWPHWWSWEPGERAEAPAAVEAPAVPDAETAGRTEAIRPLAAASPRWSDVFAEEWRAAVRGRAVVEADRPRWGWPEWLAAAYLAGVALGLARLGAGLVALGGVRVRSRIVEDAEWEDRLAILRAELGVVRAVELRESAELGTAAVVGWRRPALLLPAGWRGWDEAERRAVAAHELAHVRRGDYAAGLAAQLCLALHFYHPLAHWLARRLRLQQELAADAWGARLVGGRRPYLMTLARLALRQDERPVGGPARAFLPARGMFLRRIEMLRDAKAIRGRDEALPRPGRVLVVATLAAAGLIVAGLRGPAGPVAALAQDDKPKAAPKADNRAEPDDAMAYVPAEAGLVVSIRFADLLGRPGFKSLREPLAEAMSHKGAAGFGNLNLTPDQIERALVIWANREHHGPLRGGVLSLVPGTAWVIRAVAPQDWQAVAGDAVAEPERVSYRGQGYVRSKGMPQGPCYFTVGDRTIVMGVEADLRRLIAAKERPAARHAWDEAWAKVADRPIAAGLDTAWLVDGLQAGPGRELLTGAFAPLFDKAYGYALGLGIEKGMALEVVASGSSDDGAEAVEQTANAGLTLLRNVVQSARNRVEGVPDDLDALLQVAEPTVKAAKVTRDGRTITLRADSGVDAGQLVENVLLPMATAARSAARRTQSVNNMKQILLAWHNYHSTHDTFPPAVVMGPDGKTPHSWRVEILPFLDQKELYDQYRMNEPWDSPANRKVLEQMPRVFAASDVGRGTTTTYFTFTGPHTIGGAEGEGSTLQEIIDGTSNTIAVVEARRDVPWTKPEDIPYDADKPVPELGLGPKMQGFNAAFGDGSVRFIKFSTNEHVLRALITRDGGEVVSSDSF